jgi:2'-5' RNA ligase
VLEQSPPTVETRLKSHWDWRPDWTPDRPCLMWYLTFERQPGLASHAEQLQPGLTATEALDPVPVPWLHLTLDQVGFVDSVPPEQVDDVVESVRSTLRGWSPGPVTLGPVSTMGDAVVLDATGVDELQERLHAGTAAALDRDPDEEFREFRAHVSLAYANQPCDVDEALEPLGDAAGHQVVLDSPRLALATVTRKDGHYRWTERDEVPLAGGPANGSGPGRAAD